MKILLLNPINRSYVVMPSLGLGYLASSLTPHGHDVRILNSIKERFTYEAFGDLVGRERFDLIGFQVYSYDLSSVERHIAIIRQRSPGTVTISGGPHPSGDPHGILLYLKGLDLAFQGEAEVGLPLLLTQLEQGRQEYGSIPGLIWRKSDAIVVNPAYAVQDLDSLPLPFWDLLQPETYPEAPHGAFTLAFPTAPIITSRGCPCRCTFCAGHRISGTKIRRRSIDNVMQELHLLKDRGILEFHIEDENFTFNRDYVHAFCDRSMSEKLGMSWSLPSGIRIDTLDRDLLLAMARAGCYSLAVGVEFGSDRMLKETRKGLTVAMIRERIKLFSGMGIKVTGFFLFGVPGETREEMEQTIQLALELPLDRAQFNNFMPLPGSDAWNRLKERGLLAHPDWDRYFVHDVAHTDGTVSAIELKRLQRSAVLRFYLRPRIILGLLREIRSLRHLYYLLKRLIDAMRG